MGLISTLTAGFGLAAGATAYLVTHRDLGAGRSASIGVLSAIAVAIGFLFTRYLAVASFLAAIAVYLPARGRVRLDHAAFGAVIAFAGLAACSAAMMSALGTT